jgi:hypothetical protein
MVLKMASGGTHGIERERSDGGQATRQGVQAGGLLTRTNILVAINNPPLGTLTDMLLDFKHSARDAFWRGMLKGMAAPLAIYRLESLPPLPTIEPLCVQPTDSRTALAEDWRRIGLDMYAAIGHNEKS